MREFFKSILVVVSFVIFCNSNDVNAQASKLDYRPLTFNVNFGQTLFWGDMNDEILNPFNYYFSKTYSDYAYGLIVQKNVLPFLGFDLQYTMGHWKGQRTTWSDGVDANLNFRSSYHSFMVNADIDVLNLILKDKSYRPFNIYLRGGFGYDLVNANKYLTSDGSLVENLKGSSMQIPWGWGVRYDINKNIGITFENTFHHSLGDVLDGHDSKFTDFNDLSAYTSLGMSYRIYPKPRKPRIEKDITPVDTIPVIAVQIPDPTLNVKFNTPPTVFSVDTNTCSIIIENEKVNETAKLQVTLPYGFTADNIQAQGGRGEFIDQILSISWDALDSSIENYSIKFDLISNNTAQNSYSFPGIVFYNVSGNEKTVQFKSTLNVKPAVIAVAETKEVETTNVETKEVISPVDIVVAKPAEIGEIEYRVQIKAIYGGKSSPSQIQKQYKISTDVYEEFQNGYTKYTTGKFSNYEDAKKMKEELRSKNVPGAFVVAYQKGARVSNITDAIKLESKSTDSKTSTETSTPTNTTTGMKYSIQVAASGRNLSPESLKNQFGFSENLTKTTHNGLYKYLLGSFDSIEEANKKLESIRNNVPDAFIVKFIDGKRQ